MNTKTAFLLIAILTVSLVGCGDDGTRSRHLTSDDTSSPDNQGGIVMPPESALTEECAEEELLPVGDPITDKKARWEMEERQGYIYEYAQVKFDFIRQAQLVPQPFEKDGRMYYVKSFDHPPATEVRIEEPEKFTEMRVLPVLGRDSVYRQSPIYETDEVEATTPAEHIEGFHIAIRLFAEEPAETFATAQLYRPFYAVKKSCL